MSALQIAFVLVYVYYFIFSCNARDRSVLLESIPFPIFCGSIFSSVQISSSESHLQTTKVLVICVHFLSGCNLEVCNKLRYFISVFSSISAVECDWLIPRAPAVRIFPSGPCLRTAPNVTFARSFSLLNLVCLQPGYSRLLKIGCVLK